MPEQAVSITEVAKVAQVSQVTVARAFAGNAPVAQKTRQRVFKVAEELGYRPNLLARALRSGRTQTIGVLWSLASTPARENVPRELAIIAQSRGYVAHIADTLGDLEATEKILAEYRTRRIEGAVIQWAFKEIPESTRQILREFSAVVLVCSHKDVDTEFDCIWQDRLQAIGGAVDHLAQTGRRHPYFIINKASGKEKIGRFIQGFHRHGVNVAEPNIIDIGGAGGTLSEVYKILDGCFESSQAPVDALLCTSDEVAVAAVAWARARGMEVSKDIAIVGFDDNEILPFLDPPLASVRRCDGQVIKAIEKMIFGRLGNSDRPIQSEAIPMRFVKRESAG